MTTQPTPTEDELVGAVRRAADAELPIAVVDLVGPGTPFVPSRGEVGARYGPGEAVVRELSPSGAGALAAGMSLYPPPDPGIERVIVLPLESRNWVPYDDALERAIVDLVVR